MRGLSSPVEFKDGIRVVRGWLKTVLGLMLAGLLACGWWVFRPLPLAAPTIDLSIEPGTPVRLMAEQVVQSGVPVSPALLYWTFRLSGQSRQIRAGSYELTAGVSAWGLLQKLVRGDESLQAITLVEGWTFRQFRAALDKAEFLRHDTRDLSDDEVLKRLELATPLAAAEGRFYPDTYTYGKGSSDLKILQRAHRAMERQLSKVWAQRADGLMIQRPEEALILASIVEKETGRSGDRAMISSVFHNRLRLGMPLQTDPTVIYGMGQSFDGNLRRRDLQTDHPWNTYTRPGLPPTPIAMPGKGALVAAVQPARSRALYFVARGDGSSEFSDTLEQHNHAVNRFQRQRPSAALPPRAQ